MAIIKELFPNGDSRNADGEALGVPLRREAAGALDALNFYYKQRFGKSLTALEGMRGIAAQQFYYDRYVNRRPGWTVAAKPGTSMHGWGLAVDLGGPIQSSATAEHAWTAAHAPLFGWEWTGVDFGEPWHFDYTGRNVTPAQRDDYLKRGAPSKASKPDTPTAIKEKEVVNMWLIQTVDTKRIYLVTNQGATWLGTMALVSLAQRMIKHHGGNATPINMYQTEVDSIVGALQSARGGTTKSVSK